MSGHLCDFYGGHCQDSCFDLMHCYCDFAVDCSIGPYWDYAYLLLGDYVGLDVDERESDCFLVKELISGHLAVEFVDCFVRHPVDDCMDDCDMLQGLLRC